MPRIGKKGKIILSIAGVLLAAAIVTGIIVSAHYSAKIKKALPGRVAKITDSLYHISVKRVHINLITRSVTLKEVQLWPDSNKINQHKQDSTAPANYFIAKIPKLKVSSIMWDKLVGGEGFSCGSVTTKGADISIYPNDPNLRVNDTLPTKPPRKELSVGNIEINGDIRYVLTNENTGQVLAFKKARITLNDWRLNKATLKDTTRFALAETGTIAIDTFEYLHPEMDYRFIMQKVAFNSKRKALTAGDITLKLKMSNEEFYRKHGIQKEIYDIHFPTFELTDIDWQRLFSTGELHASTLYLNQSKIDVLFDRQLPPNNQSKMGKFPNQMLYKLQLPLNIRKIRINDGSVIYSEVSDRTGQKGSINFDKISGEVSNITNIQALVDSQPVCEARLNAKLSKYTDVNTVFRFQLNDAEGNFSVDADIAGLQGHQINEQTKAFTLIAVRSLNLKNLTMNLKGNEHYTESDFKMEYTNLGIKVLKKETDAKKEKRKKGFITFVANNLILYSSNPMPGGKLRTVHTYVRRDELKSFFNQIWRNIHQGVQETTIRDMDVINWFRRQDKRRKEEHNRAMKNVFDPDA